MSETQTQLKQKKNRLEEFISKNKVYLQGEPYPVGDNYAIDVSQTGLKDRQTLNELRDEAQKYNGAFVGSPKPRFLFPQVNLNVPKGYKLLYLYKEDIEAGGPQPRSEISPNDPETATLFESIKERGQEDPIDVYPSPLGNGKYRIVEGHRRKLICFDSLYGKFPGGPGMWAIFKERTEQEAYEAALILNDKKQIGASEKGHFYEVMMEKFPEAYPTLESVGKKVGASHQQISNIITAYQQIKHLKPQLEPTIATQVAMLSEVVVRPIKSAPESAKVALVSVVAEKGLSGRESAALVEVAKANPDVTKEELEAEADRLQKEKVEDRLLARRADAEKLVKKTEREVAKLARSVEEVYPESLVKAIYGHLSYKGVKLSDDRMRKFCPVFVDSLVKVARERGFLDEALADAEAWL